MIKKSTRILALVGMMLTVLAVVALALVVFGSSENNPPEEIISTENTNNTTTTNSTDNVNDDNVKITPAEAQQIAEKYIKEVGATAGTPKLDEIDGEMVYIVPVVINGTTVGEIDINAMTGENMGGAGGVSV
ncbi:MAG: hypothetical protein A4E25_02411 [Methanobacterium sp. PtaB.Bin024]|nr:MAG: hypothetical protein A4E25_02411 [Methanobacterium sp. PtaB.Bin024]